MAPDAYESKLGFYEPSEAPDDDLWFLPSPLEDELSDSLPGPRADPPETSIIADWVSAEAACAARLATVAGRLGALQDRLERGPQGWRHRLALLEASELSWFSGDRVTADRLGLWVTLRVSSAQEDSSALGRAGWALRRLVSGPEPEEGLTAFLDRYDPKETDDRLTDRVGSWQAVMADAVALHSISRACMGYHLWSLAGLGQIGDRIEAAVTASRIASGRQSFAPVALGGAGGLRAGGTPVERLTRWLNGMMSAIQTAMRSLDDVEAWSARADEIMVSLSGRTPPALCAVLTEWPLVSAPMAEALTGASRAAVQRNLSWMETQGLITEVTQQGRFRMWKVNV